MKVTCPHCSSEMHVEKKQSPNGWTFTRCIQCGGFSCIKQSNHTAIKVNSNLKQPMEFHEIRTQPTIKPAQPKRTISKATPPPFRERMNKPKIQKEVKSVSKESSFPEPLPEINIMQSSKTDQIQTWVQKNIITVSLSISAALTIISGAYLIFRVESEKPQISMSRVELTPEVKKNTPIQTIQSTQASSKRNTENKIKKQRISPKIENRFFVKTTVPNVKMRSGPGLHYPVISRIKDSTTFEVISFKDRWFQIKNTFSGRNQTAWIRNDHLKKASVNTSR
ncbi:MAG: hypothetical protein CL678_14430 [Bdellovibrionaceae bacterium]|nr:hypothetical protein [Pseudobdellovibrionaceae bacterium]|tara:strand:- start:1237 stop:2076 length:840 start_codon:yes stop_codon:yes gene_type:complete